MSSSTPTCSTPHDAHVDAAARACSADILLTNNVRHFPEGSTGAGYDVLTTDEFFCLIDDSHPPAVAAATVRQLEYWWRRNEECHLPDSLTAAGCATFAERVRKHQLAADLDHLSLYDEEPCGS